MVPLAKRFIFFTAFFLLLTCIGCAQKKSTASVQDTAVESMEEQGDDMDMLLSDDFFDNESVAEEMYYDPLEPINRVFFEFNDKLYYWVLDPFNTVYRAVLPEDFRYSIGNFVSNLAAPIRLVNNLLQWKVSDAGVVLSRFLINSTLGVYGFGDPAGIEFGLKPRPEDFGQTLGYWGVGEGLYLCLPVLGPSSARDTVGFGADAYTHPMVYFVDDFRVSGGYYSVSRVNLLSLNPDVYEDLKKYSLDPYVSMRQVYLDYRRKKIDDTALTYRSDNEL
jgi:phospholipid-binding lipoprotein MlaA